MRVLLTAGCFCRAQVFPGGMFWSPEWGDCFDGLSGCVLEAGVCIFGCRLILGDVSL